MASKLVTCPETGHLENIDYEDHPLGMLISFCTRASRSCPLTCPRTCARRFDLRDRLVRPVESYDVGDDTALDIWIGVTT